MANRFFGGKGISSRRLSRRGRAGILMAVLPAALASSAALAANLTWDSSGNHPLAPVDGGGNWDTTTADWSNGSTDVVWDNVSTAVFGNGGTAGNVTIDDLSGTVTTAGLTFNAGVTGNYLIGASGTDTLTLSGSNPIISVAAGANATISAPIAGSFGSDVGGNNTSGLIIKGLGTLTLTGVSTYSGSTIIENNGGNNTGTAVILGGAGSLGNSASNVYVGFNGTALALDTSTLAMTGTSTLTAATLVVGYNFGESNLSTTSGAVLNVNGNNTINANTITITAGRNNGNTKGGFGRLIVNTGATLTLNDAANDGGPVTLLDIADYSFETGGTTGSGTAGTVDFSAGTVNGNITTVNVGEGKTGSGNASGGQASGTLLFGNGTLNIGTLNIARHGSNPSNGNVTLIAGSTGTMNLGSLTFNAAGGNGTQSGPGVLNINGGSVILTGDVTGTSATASNAVINLAGGFLDMQGHNIGTSTSTPITFNAAAGTVQNIASINGTGALVTTGNATQILHMMGTSTYTGGTTIGGGTVIVGAAGAMGSGGPLTNNGGTLDLGGFSQTVAGLSGTGGIITNKGVSAPITLTVNGSTGNYAGQFSDGTSSVALSVTNNSTVNFTSATAQTYSGATNVNAGSALVFANINSATSLTDNGNFAAVGTVGAIALDQGANLTPGPVVSGNTTGALHGTTLAVGSGGATLDFLATSATNIDELLLSGTATLNGPLTVNVLLSATVPSNTYTLVSASSLITNSNTITPAITVAGGGLTRLSATIQPTANAITLIVNGSPANLTWTGTADGTTWDVDTTHNWTSTAPTNPNVFFNQDKVNFTNTGAGTVNIVGTVLPASVTFTNDSAHPYTFTGSGISESGSGTNVTLNGNGTVTFNNANTYAGNTTVNSGTLEIGSSGSISGNTLASAGGSTVNINAGGNVSTTTSNIAGNLSVSGTLGGTTLTLSSPAAAVVPSGGNISTAAVAVNGGSLDIQAGGTLAATTLSTANGATLTIESGANLTGAPSFTNNGNTTMSSSQTIGGFNGTDPTATLTMNGTLSVGHSGTYAGIIQDASPATPGSIDVTANTLTLTGASTYTGTTSVNSGATLVIDAGANTGSLNPASTISDSGTVIYNRTGAQAVANAISGGGTFEQNGGGTLTLTGNNSGFSGNIAAYNGTILQNDANSFGTGGYILGTPETATAATTATGCISLNAAVTTQSVTSISSTSGSLTAAPAANVLTVPAGVTLSVSNGMTIGSSNTGATGVFNVTSVTGGGSLVISAGNITVSQASSMATLDLSGLNSFSMINGGSVLNIGNGTGAQGTVTLANTTVGGVAPTNTIIASAINMSTTSTNNPSGVSTLNLGSGVNNLFASTITLGSGRGVGVIQFIAGAPATASVNIADSSGSGPAAIVLENGNTNGAQFSAPALLSLAGFTANVNASSLIISEQTNASGLLSGGTVAAVTFDTGNFAVSGNVSIAVYSGGGSTTGPVGSLTIGGATPNATATGTFSAGGIVLGDYTNTNGATAGAIANATLTLNGGSLTLTGNILNASTTGNTVSTFNFNSGTLNMNGSSIGGNGTNAGNNTITVVLPALGQTATLLNLGGGGINNAGIDMNGAGVLKMDGSNSYTGSTAVNAGGTISLLATGTLPSTTDVIDNGTLSLTDPSQTINSLNSTTAGVLNLNTTQLTITTGGSFVGRIQDNGNGTSSLSIPAATTFTNDSVNVGSLNVSGTEVFRNQTVRTLSKVGSLTVAGTLGAWTGGIDLTDSRLIVEDTSGTRSTDLAMYKDMAANTGNNTVGLYSSTAAAINTTAGHTVQVVAVVNNAVRLATDGASASNFGTGVGNVDANSILITAAYLGDANLDGVVDIKDLQVLANNWQKSVTDWSQGDFNGDGIVDIRDLQFIANDWQDGVGAPGAGSGESFGQALALLPEFGGTSSVPEPMSLAMLGLGGVVLASRRRRKG